MIYFTADPHFGHANIIKYCNRPFTSSEEMDRVILSNYNNTVQKTDELWILGDFCWFDRHNPEINLKKYREQINCNNIKLILGNHDPHNKSKYWEPHEILFDYFESVYTMTNSIFRNRKFTLCHYAMRTWDQSHRDAIQLYGHTHYGLPDDGSLSMDVGVDAVAGRKTGLTKVEIAESCEKGLNPLNPLDYKPLSIDEILNTLNKNINVK